MIVGAPSVDLSGSNGGVFLFDGTTGAQIAAIASPATTPIGFGSAVASVGPNILIGAPQDHSGAGAAFLYAPPAIVGGNAALLTTFIQPDGGGGNFGTSVAGTQNTALIGAPGAYLATPDAGAAYLFDANPASPTFGNAIGAVQESAPTSGDDFGAAVGFDTGNLIVGAAGLIGSSAARG